MLILDLDGDGIITLNDRTTIGDPTPDFNYGFSNTSTWRRFELSGLLQGVRGGKILNEPHSHGSSTSCKRRQRTLVRRMDSDEHRCEVSESR